MRLSSHLAIVLVAAGAMTCDAQANRPQRSTAPRGAARVEPRTFDPDVVRIDPQSPVGRVLDALRRDEDAAAVALATEALAATNDEAERGRLRWLLARAARATGDEATALGRLDELASSPHPLAPWARLRRAEILEPRDAAAAAVEAARAPEGFGGTKAARSLHARALARAGRADEATPLLRALVDAAPPDSAAASVAMPLAEILAAGDAAAKEEALALYRRVAAYAPLTDSGRDATTRAAALLATLPPDRRSTLASPHPALEIARAQSHLDALRTRDAESILTTLLDGHGTVPSVRSVSSVAGVRCEARLLLGKAQLRRRARAEGAATLERVLAECTDPEVRAAARFHAGKAHAGRDAHAEAIAHFDALASELPTHRLSDDAQLRAALSARDAGDLGAFRTRLTTLVDSSTPGDMRGEALFTLALATRESGDLPAALALFDRAFPPPAHVVATGEEAEDLAGRAAYWRARTLADLGRNADAAAAYDELARHRPLSYYAQQALARLGELDAARARATTAALHGETGGGGHADTPPASEPAPARAAAGPRAHEPIRFPWRAELDTPSFARALELFRVAENDLAARELAFLGATGEGADPDLVWLAAALFDRAGAHADSVRLARRRLRAFMRTTPAGPSRALWRIAYPRAFSPLIDDAAAQEQLPAAFVRAIAREESGFDPSAVSIASAYGLVQVIEPTARRHARPLGLPSDPAALRRPHVNVRIGARYMSFLATRYAGRVEMIPPAYNAGEGAADRWLRERGSEPLDLWVEHIPYDETRRYTRRVLQTYGIYAWLDEGRLPPLRRDLPPPR